MTAPLTLAVLPAVAARPEASGAQPDAAADSGDTNAFASALEVARRPADDGANKAKPQGNARAEDDSQVGGKADEAASSTDPAPPDLTGLLPGWPAPLVSVATGTTTAAPPASKARDRASDVAALLASDASSARESRRTDSVASVPIAAAGASVGVDAAFGAVAGSGVPVGSTQRGERREGKASSMPPALASFAATTPNTVAAQATPRVRSSTPEVLPVQPAARDIDAGAAVTRDDSARRESRVVDGASVGNTQRSERHDGHAATALTASATIAAAAPNSTAHETSTSNASAATDALPTQLAAAARGSDPSLAATLPALAGPAFAPRETIAAVAPALFEAHLAATLDSPTFAPALATQVKWLVHEGVQQARLSLNPAEMGPVAVQIVLDGTQARVDFSADMASTRAAIEASLPMLAAALHDSGLTLAGGGVFDGQARHGAQGQQQSGPAQPRADGAPTPAAGEKTATTAVRKARGLVDLVA